jgi:hypothetical protein
MKKEILSLTLAVVFAIAPIRPAEAQVFQWHHGLFYDIGMVVGGISDATVTIITAPFTLLANPPSRVYPLPASVHYGVPR